MEQANSASRSNSLRLAKIECGLKHPRTRDKFQIYLRDVCLNKGHANLIDAYVHLSSDDPAIGLQAVQNMNNEEPLNFDEQQFRDLMNFNRKMSQDDMDSLRNRLIEDITETLRTNFGNFSKENA